MGSQEAEGAAAYHKATMDDDNMSDKEEQQVCRRKKKGLESGMNRLGASTVVRNITWLHEVVYTLEDKPAAYQDISVPLFVHHCG